MGGGDLNLKKSWHPSTLRNIERVWKAEQKHDAEQRKIEQLQKELQDERAKEEIQQYAENQGVVKKKNERLDWMYQGPAALVDREQYLVGRSVDKTFEVLDQLQNNKLPEDDSAHPGAIFSQSSFNETIDLANKIREDPLFTIKKKETEQKKNLLNNPVKMKQLRELLEMAVAKKDKKNKKHRKAKNDDAKKERKSKSRRDRKAKRRELGRKGYDSSEEENAKSGRKHREERRKRRNGSESEDESDSGSSSDRHDVNDSRNRKHRREVCVDTGYGDRRNRREEPRGGRERDDDHGRSYHSKPYGLILSKNSHYVRSDPRQNTSRHSRSRSPVAPGKKIARVPSPPRRKLTLEEMEEKRRIMMEDAKWRDEQRERNVRKYKREEEKEDAQKGKPVDFLRPMLSAATDSGSVESRIRQKMFNLQRSGSAMNENFARK